MELDAETLYTTVCLSAVDDGKLHPDEAVVLGHLRETLGLSDEDARRLEDDARKQAAGGRSRDRLDPEELYRTACRIALDDGVLDYGEAHHLTALADALDLSTERATALLEEIELTTASAEVRIGEPLEAFEGEDTAS